jgi:protein-disulfide isomerase
MQRSKIILFILTIAIIGFVAAQFIWQSQQRQTASVIKDVRLLERDYSPSFGPKDAKVTLVEFFDPACETCKAFHPLVTQIKEKLPKDIRVVLRYAAFHQGSDQVITLLEAARLQYLFMPVLEALYKGQAQWAMHGKPDIDKAWQIAKNAGLDIKKAKLDSVSDKIKQRLAQDAKDIEQLGVQKTPSFYVNGKPLTVFGAQELVDLVQSEFERKPQLKDAD